MGFQKRLRARLQASCAAYKKRGLGWRSPPLPICKHNVRMTGFKFRVSGLGLRQGRFMKPACTAEKRGILCKQQLPAIFFLSFFLSFYLSFFLPAFLPVFLASFLPWRLGFPCGLPVSRECKARFGAYTAKGEKRSCLLGRSKELS